MLIPRPETDCFCLAAADRLRAAADRPLRVYDLCAGSGCVGLGLASLLKGVEVTAVELSPEAFVYLERNCEGLSGLCRQAGSSGYLPGCRPVSGPGGRDPFQSSLYPGRGASRAAAGEVRREPRMALDGGDGLRFIA